MTNGYFSYIAHEHRHSTLLLEHDHTDIVQGFYQAYAANQILLSVMGQHAAARVGVVAGKGLIHFLQCYLVMPHAIRIHQRLILLDVATLGIDLRHARNATQQWPHHPVLSNAAFGQLFLTEHPLTVVWLLQSVLINLTQSGRQWAENRCHVLRHTPAYLDQALHYQLACEIDIGRIGKHQSNQR